MTIIVIQKLELETMKSELCKNTHIIRVLLIIIIGCDDFNNLMLQTLEWQIQFILISVHVKIFCMFRARLASKFSKSASITLKFPRPSPPPKKKNLIWDQKLKFMLVFKNIENFAIKLLQTKLSP